MEKYGNLTIIRSRTKARKGRSVETTRTSGTTIFQKTEQQLHGHIRKT
jgi:hypothetical protein